MQSLTAMERTAFVMRHFEGCSIAEISGALKLSEGSAKQGISRAVRKLRSALGPLVMGRA